MILNGFKYYKVQLNQEMDILAAGDVDTGHITHTDEKIMLMLNDIENLDDNLMERE